MRRNTALRCGNLRSFTLSKLPQVILARLVLLASTQFLHIGFATQYSVTLWQPSVIYA